MPTLLVGFARDVVVPVHSVRRMAEAVPGAEFAEIDGAAHGGVLTHARECLREVLAFLDRHGLWRPQRAGQSSVRGRPIPTT